MSCEVKVESGVDRIVIHQDPTPTLTTTVETETKTKYKKTSTRLRPKSISAAPKSKIDKRKGCSRKANQNAASVLTSKVDNLDKVVKSSKATKAAQKRERQSFLELQDCLSKVTFEDIVSAPYENWIERKAARSPEHKEKVSRVVCAGIEAVASIGIKTFRFNREQARDCNGKKPGYAWHGSANIMNILNTVFRDHSRVCECEIPQLDALLCALESGELKPVRLPSVDAKTCRYMKAAFSLQETEGSNMDEDAVSQLEQLQEEEDGDEDVEMGGTFTRGQWTIDF